MPEDGDSFSGLLFVAQIIAVPLLAAVLGSALVEFLDFVTGTHEGNWVVGLICYSIVGMAEGFFIQEASGSAAGSGGFFIWIPLLCITVAGVLRDGRRARSGPQRVADVESTLTERRSLGPANDANLGDLLLFAGRVLGQYSGEDPSC